MAAVSCRACSTRTSSPERHFLHAGTRKLERTTLLRRDLTSFESLVDRRQMQARRQMLVEVSSDRANTDMVGGLHGWRIRSNPL